MSLSKNISSHFNKHNKEGGGIFIIFINYYFCFIFSFLFQFLDSPSQKITMRDFHQVTFKQYFNLQQQFNVFVCLLFIFFILFYLLFCVCVWRGGGGGCSY